MKYRELSRRTPAMHDGQKSFSAGQRLLPLLRNWVQVQGKRRSLRKLFLLRDAGLWKVQWPTSIWVPKHRVSWPPMRLLCAVPMASKLNSRTHVSENNVSIAVVFRPVHRTGNHKSTVSYGWNNIPVSRGALWDQKSVHGAHASELNGNRRRAHLLFLQRWSFVESRRSLIECCFE